MNYTINADNKEQLQVAEADDSCRHEFSTIVLLTGDTHGSCTAEGVSGDWSAAVRQENLALMKQEPDDVCCVLFTVFTLSRHIQFMLIISYT